MDNSFFNKHRDKLFCLFLIIATLSVYWQISHHDFVNYDDMVYVTGNSNIQAGLNGNSIFWAFTTTRTGNWHPITWLSLMLDYQLFGMNAKGYHLVNLLLHIINSLLLFIVLKKMTGRFWPSGIVAGLFALHPLHVESVAWISERKDVLSALFWMLTLWSYSWYTDHPKIQRYLLVLLCFVLGLLTKPMLVSLPVIMLLLDYWPLNRIFLNRGDKTPIKKQRLIIRRMVWEKIPFILLAVISSVITFFIQKQAGAVGSLGALPLGTRIANALVSYVLYLYKTILPFNMGVLYPYQNMIHWWKILGASIILIFIFWFVLKNAKSRPYLIVGWLWYFVTLIPVIGIVQVGTQAMADRYTYIPLIGIFILCIWAISELISSRSRLKIFFTILMVVIIMVFSTITYFQLGYWKNSISLWEHTLNVTSNNFIAHNNLGRALLNEERIDEAIYHGKEALRINPHFADARNILGNAMQKQGRFDEAIEHYSEALRINPNDEKTHNDLGVTLKNMGRIDEAIEHYKKALDIRPDYAEALNNLGNLLQIQGRTDEAIEHYQSALRLMPSSPEVLYNLGTVLSSQGRIPEAMHQFRKALHLKPDFADAHASLGYTLQKLGRIDEAISHYEAALRINPHSAELHFNMASALDSRGESNEGVKHYKEALKIDPDSIKAHYNLGNVLHRLKRLDEAIEHFEAVIRLKPDYVDAYNNLGAVLYYKGDINGSIDCFQKALQIDPDNIQIKNNLEQLLNIQKQRQP